MDVPPPLPGPLPFRDPGVALAGLAPARAANILAAAADVTLVLDRDGVIRDMAVAASELDHSAFTHWLDQRWCDTVAADSRPKIAEMLAESGDAEPRWRQVNHGGSDGHIPVRYLTIETGTDGRMIAIGRDMRAAAALQQRLLTAQQSMERDYVRLRQTELRYRLLFDMSSEPVLIVDGTTRRITDANPAARRLVAASDSAVAGQGFVAIIHPADRDDAIAMLGAATAGQQSQPVLLRLARDGSALGFQAALFRQERATHFLIRAVPDPTHGSPQSDDHRLLDLVDRMPDAFVLADGSLQILAENIAFLDLTQFARKEEIRGLPLGDFLGRPGIDLGLLVTELEGHGSVRNFETIMRSRYGDEEDVEVSAVLVPGAGRIFGFAIRSIARRLASAPAGQRPEPRSVDQLTELVGRVPLKDIVRESTDLIERLCIEAALEYTANNRASAAEMLGLSRQSLYSKLRRHGLYTPANGEPDEFEL